MLGKLSCKTPAFGIGYDKNVANLNALTTRSNYCIQHNATKVFHGRLIN